MGFIGSHLSECVCDRVCLTLTGGHPKYHSTPADYTVYSSLSHTQLGIATSVRQVILSEINHRSFVAPLLS